MHVCVTEGGFARFTGQYDPTKCETRSSSRRQKEGRKGADLSTFSQIPMRASACIAVLSLNLCADDLDQTQKELKRIRQRNLPNRPHSCREYF